MNRFREALCTELVSHFNVSAAVLDGDAELFSGGLLDSLRVLDLVSFVERQVGQQISPMEITLENFDTVNRIVTFVTGLRDGTDAKQ